LQGLLTQIKTSSVSTIEFIFALHTLLISLVLCLLATPTLQMKLHDPSKLPVCGYVHFSKEEILFNNSSFDPIISAFLTLLEDSMEEGFVEIISILQGTILDKNISIKHKDIAFFTADHN